jgi:hypothetical protein
MRIKLIGHSPRRMTERGVSMEDIEHALRNYGFSESQKLDADPGKSRIVGPPVDGYRLHVVVMGELPPGRSVRVVTVYWKTEGEPQ